jgi:copper chaperone CopZ
MEHSYKIEGMTCASCLNKVTEALKSVKGIRVKSIGLDPPEAKLSMTDHVETAILNEAVRKVGNYSIIEEGKRIEEGNWSGSQMMNNAGIAEASPVTYKPLIIILIYLLGFVFLSQVQKGNLDWMDMMSKFMGGFFIVFSFFKMLDVKGFAYSYSSYDIIAKKWFGYGFIYPFIELGLGIAYLMNFNLLITNSVTLIVMGVSTIGVLQAVFKKNKIQCAC